MGTLSGRNTRYGDSVQSRKSIDLANGYTRQLDDFVKDSCRRPQSNVADARFAQKFILIEDIFCHSSMTETLFLPDFLEI